MFLDFQSHIFYIRSYGGDICNLIWTALFSCILHVFNDVSCYNVLSQIISLVKYLNNNNALLNIIVVQDY